MVIVRWVGAPWALMQVLSYNSMEYPPGMRNLGLALVALLAAGNALVHITYPKLTSLSSARALAISSLGLDVVVVSGIVWVYAFDPGSALWAVLFILPLEGAIRFQLRGALFTWLTTAIVYSMREVWASDRYGRELEWNSITFRMGIGLLIAIVAGLMARDLVRQRTRLAEALAELQRIDSLRRGLVSTLAHDVRNPLTVIRGSNSTLLTRGHSFEWPTVVELVTSSDRQAERLQRLATDLLDLARLERGRLELDLQPVALRQVVDQAMSFADVHDKFEINVDPDHRVLAAPDRLEQVIVNLVTNALRYGAPPFSIVSADEGRWICLSVNDDGPGIPPEQQPHLFEAFRTEAYTGSVGFGLAIVKALVEAQGGQVEYLPGHPGATFRVLLEPATG